MSGECNGVIDQERGGLSIIFVVKQCEHCNESDCFGKLALGIKALINMEEGN
jgi:hypothetical protein